MTALERLKTSVTVRVDLWREFASYVVKHHGGKKITRELEVAIWEYLKMRDVKNLPDIEDKSKV